ncbi:MAG: hypothetical protein CMF61_02795 [Magnetococcales bacterium]|nr:hypothetical protein [Magnetococcales bacterium]PPR19350.1 MAG: hypothetical protein CFH43_00241 [Pseudomonadota bacterium]
MKLYIQKALCFVVILTTAMITVLTVQAQERAVDFNTDSIDDATLAKYKKIINDKKSDLVTIANTVGDIRDCHNQKLIYTSSGCVNPVTPESDPSRKAQAASSAPVSTCPTGYAHNWNGTSWTCKEIRKTVNSGVPSDTGTWQLVSGESCWDHFMRKCKSSDDTCPTPGNPLGVACSSQPFCRYAEEGANNFMEAVCN